jgi:hypothetical protein
MNWNLIVNQLLCFYDAKPLPLTLVSLENLISLIKTFSQRHNDTREVDRGCNISQVLS